MQIKKHTCRIPCITFYQWSDPDLQPVKCLLLLRLLLQCEVFLQYPRYHIWICNTKCHTATSYNRLQSISHYKHYINGNGLIIIEFSTCARSVHNEMFELPSSSWVSFLPLPTEQVQSTLKPESRILPNEISCSLPGKKCVHKLSTQVSHTGLSLWWTNPLPWGHGASVASGVLKAFPRYPTINAKQ